MSFTVKELPRGTQAASRKRFVATFHDNRQRVRFGQPGATTYIDGASEAKKAAYLARHGAVNSDGIARENWTLSGSRTPGYLSRWLLWGPSRSLAVNASMRGGNFARR